MVFVWAALLLGATGAKATPVETLVQDTLYRADGSAAQGNLVIRWNDFSTSAGDAVAAGEMTVPIAANGGISIPLIPNAGSSPSGSYYKVVMKLNDGTISEEQWVVPVAASTTVAAIRAKVVPQAVAAQFVSLDYLNSALSKISTATPQVNTDWNSTSGASQLLDKPVLAAVATSGSYSDLSNTPVIANLAAPGPIGATAPNMINATNVTAQGIVTSQTPVADIRAFGAKCDGVTDDTAALQAAITALHSTGGKIATFGTCYIANPAQLTWGNTSILELEVQGNLTVGTTFVVPNNVHIVGDGGAAGLVQFNGFGPEAGINGQTTVGTLGTSFAAGAATFTPSSMTGIVPGAAITVAGLQSCTITSIARASNVVTASLSASCRTPAGVDVTVAGVTDTSYNGTFLVTASDYGKNTISWQQSAANSTSTGGTLTGLNEQSVETVFITSTTSTTATATFLHAHNAADQFGVVVLAFAYQSFSDHSVANINVGGCGGACIWSDYAAMIGLYNVGAGASANLTSLPMELTTSWWVTIERGSFLNATNGSSQPWGMRFDETTGADSTGVLSVTDTTIGGGVKIDTNGLSGKTQQAGNIVFRHDIFEEPVTAAIVVDPRGAINHHVIVLDDPFLQDNFANYSPCTGYYTDYAANGNGNGGGFDIRQSDNILTGCKVGGYFDGTLMVNGVAGSTLNTKTPTNPVGVWNDGKTLEAELRGEGAAMGPQLIPYATQAIAQPTSWTSGACTVTQGVLAPDGTTSAASLTYNSAGYITASQPGFTTNAGDWFIYGAWLKPDGGASTINAAGQGIPFWINSNGSNDVFANSYIPYQAYPNNFETVFNGDWWAPVVAVAQLQTGDGGSHSYAFNFACPGSGGGALDAWAPFMIHIPASAGVTAAEVERWRQQLLHGYVPPGMPGGGILAMNPAHKLYWGSDTDLYRGAAGVVQTDGSFKAGTTTIDPVNGVTTPKVSVGNGTPSVINITAQTVSALPTTGNTLGDQRAVSNGANAADCTVGGGTTFLWCYWNGSAWNAESSVGPQGPAGATGPTGATGPAPTPSNLGASTYNASGSTTMALNSSPWAMGSVTVTHSTSSTLTITGSVAGGSYVLEIKQDSTGGGTTLTLGSGCTWKIGGGGAGAITLSSGANAMDVLAFIYDGSNCIANFRTNFN